MRHRQGIGRGVVAVIIRCGGGGGGCSRQLGVAETNPGRGPENPILGLSNQGWPLENGYPLLQASVPRDFQGSTGIFMCPRHGKYWEGGRPTGPPPYPGFPPDGIDWVEGMAVQMPYRLLQEPLERFVATGAVQELLWNVADHQQVVISDQL